jgi:predicted MFS family arabinose efflux permease
MMLAGFIGRLPMGMVGLGLTLLIVGTAGSYALAGAVAATLTISMALVGPYNARLTDRIGQRLAIPALVAVHVSSFLLLAAAVSFGWPTALWFVLAAGAGMSAPNLGAMTRARWVRIARSGSERSSAFAVESVADELAFVIGPVVAASLAVSLAPAAPILVGMLAISIGGLWLAAQRGTAPPPGRALAGPRPRGHVMRTPGLGSLFAVMLAMGAMFGSLNVSVVAYSQAVAPQSTGLLLGTMSFGSLLSGVALGAVARRWSLTNQVRTGTATLTVAILPLTFIADVAAFGTVAFVLGLNFSVVMIGTFGLAERMSARNRITEGLALMGSGLALGMATGTSTAGVIIDAAGARPALGLAAAFAASAMLLFWTSARGTAQRERAADAVESDALPEPAQPQSLPV